MLIILLLKCLQGERNAQVKYYSFYFIILVIFFVIIFLDTNNWKVDTNSFENNIEDSLTIKNKIRRPMSSSIYITAKTQKRP